MAHIPVHPKATFVTACDPNPHPTAHPHVPVVPQLGCAEGLNTTALPAAWTGAGSLGEVQEGQGMQKADMERHSEERAGKQWCAAPHHPSCTGSL